MLFLSFKVRKADYRRRADYQVRYSNLKYQFPFSLRTVISCNEQLLMNLLNEYLQNNLYLIFVFCDIMKLKHFRIEYFKFYIKYNRFSIDKFKYLHVILY